MRHFGKVKLILGLALFLGAGWLLRGVNLPHEGALAPNDRLSETEAETLVIPESEAVRSLEVALEMQSEDLVRVRGMNKSLENALVIANEKKEAAQRFYASELEEAAKLRGHLHDLRVQNEILEDRMHQYEQSLYELEGRLEKAETENRQAISALAQEELTSAELATAIEKLYKRNSQLSASLQAKQTILHSQLEKYAVYWTKDSGSPDTLETAAGPADPIEPPELPGQENVPFSINDGLNAYKSGDFDRAFTIWLRLAEKGNRRAQFYIGGLYFDGLGTEQDPVLAVYWLQRSANLGFPAAIDLVRAVAEKVSPSDIADAQALLDAHKG